MITADSIGLDERLGKPVPQQVIQTVNRALERTYGGGFDLSSVGRPEPFEAALILDHVREVLRWWARWPSEHALTIAALWVAHTWFTGAEGVLLFPATPRLLLVAPKSSGKGHPHGTNILTPAGWRKIEDLTPGDQVTGSSGMPVKVLDCYRRGDLPVYEVTFWDGTSVKTDAEHLWAVRPYDNRRRPEPVIKSTGELAESLPRQWNIPLTAPVQFPEQDLPLDPYVLGVLLGDGYLRDNGASLSTDKATLEALNERLPEGYRVRNYGGNISRGRHGGRHQGPNAVVGALRSLGLTGKKAADKFVPDMYLYASIDQRLALLRGLMDTDGELRRENSATGFSSASETLRDQVAFLVQSLGGTASKGIKHRPQFSYRGEKRTGQPSYRLFINIPVNPFLTREGWQPHSRGPLRTVRSVTPCGTAPVTCIRVDAPDSLYVTEHCIVTHNTRMERIMAAMSREPVGPAVGVVTAPGVRNALKKHRTVFLDEAHRIFLGRRYDLQGILTGGYTPGSVTLNGIGGEDNDESVFGPVCIGAQPKLLDSHFSEDIEDLFERSFIIRPEQHRPCRENCLKLHEHISAIPQLNAEFEQNAENAGKMLALWASAETLDQEKLYNIHAMNPDLSSRGHEISIALCAVADRAPDYRYAEGTPEYLRWAIAAREATCGLLLGTDDGKKTMTEIRESLEKLKEKNA